MGSLQLELRRLLQSIVRLQCKKEHAEECWHIVVKVSSVGASVFPMLMELFPGAECIFNTRYFTARSKDQDAYFTYTHTFQKL